MEVLEAHGTLVEWPLSWTGTAPVRPATHKQQVQPQIGELPGLGQGGQLPLLPLQQGGGRLRQLTQLPLDGGEGGGGGDGDDGEG